MNFLGGVGALSADRSEVLQMTTARQTPGFSNDQCLVSLRASVDIIEKWRASTDQACRILRISRGMHRRAKQRDVDWSVSLDSDQVQRISLVLNIHAALRLTFDNPKNVYGFPALANYNEFFNGRPPLEIMAQGDMISLYESFRRIDALRVSLW